MNIETKKLNAIWFWGIEVYEFVANNFAFSMNIETKNIMPPGSEELMYKNTLACFQKFYIFY